PGSMPGVPATAPRYLSSGHAIGAAQSHRLNDTHNFNHVVPTLGATVLPSTGGLSKGVVRDFSFHVDQPRRRNLLVVRRIETSVAGHDLGTKYETELEAEVEAIHVIDKLHIDRVAMHM